MTTTRIAVVFAAALSLAACASDQGDKQTLGTLIGAGLGGLAGSQVGSGTGQLAAIGAGVLLGGLLGNETISEHPDTGHELTGIEIPGWQELYSVEAGEAIGVRVFGRKREQRSTRPYVAL